MLANLLKCIAFFHQHFLVCFRTRIRNLGQFLTACFQLFFKSNAVIGKTGWLTVKHVQVFAWVLKLKRVHHYGNYRAQFCVVVFFSFLCLVSSTMYMSLLQLPIYFCLYFLMQGCSICVQVFFLLFLQDYIFSLFVFDLVGVVT